MIEDKISVVETVVVHHWHRLPTGWQLPCGCIGPDIFSCDTLEQSECTDCRRGWHWMTNGWCQMLDGQPQGPPVLVLTEAMRVRMIDFAIIVAGLTTAQKAELLSTPDASEYGTYTKHQLPKRPLIAAALARKGLLSCFTQTTNPLHERAYTTKQYARTKLGSQVAHFLRTGEIPE